MGEVKSTLAYVNGLLLLTINEAEKTLLSLPRKGDRVEVETAKKKTECNWNTSDVVLVSKKHSSTRNIGAVVKPLTLSPPPRSDAPRAATPAVTSSSTSQKRHRDRMDQKHSVDKTPSARIPQPCRDGATTTTTTTVASSHCPSIKVVGDKVKVTPLCEATGVLIELAVELKESGGGQRVVAIEIECPQFAPTRIRVDGKWRNIV